MNRPLICCVIAGLMCAGCSPAHKPEVTVDGKPAPEPLAKVVAGNGQVPAREEPAIQTAQTVAPEVAANGSNEIKFTVKLHPADEGMPGWEVTTYRCTFAKGKTSETFDIDLVNASTTEGTLRTGAMHQVDRKLCPEFVKAAYATMKVPYQGQIGAPVAKLKFEPVLLLDKAARKPTVGFTQSATGTVMVYEGQCEYDMGSFYLILDLAHNTGSVAVKDASKAKNLADYLNVVLNEKQDSE